MSTFDHMIGFRGTGVLNAQPGTYQRFLFHHSLSVNCRRKDLKQAVHRLRNQLQLHQTKKATTISVLQASELEIKVNDLVVVQDQFCLPMTELMFFPKLVSMIKILCVKVNYLPLHSKWVYPHLYSCNRLSNYWGPHNFIG